MDAKEIVDGLINGSRAIDQMKKDVNSVVRMVIGFVELERKSFVTKHVGFTFETHKWEISNHFDETVVRCHVDLGFAWSLAYSSHKGEIPFKSYMAQAVYEGLPLLVEGVMKAYPNIDKRWQYLLDAAKK
jgi:hypothetical protein